MDAPAERDTYDREWAEVLAMAEIARAAWRGHAKILSSGTEQGLRQVTFAAGLWCWVGVSYPSWLAADPTQASYQVDVTRHGEHLGSFLTGIRAEDGPLRIARMLTALTSERPLLRELAAHSPDPAAAARTLFEQADPPVRHDDPVADLAAACGLVPAGEPTSVIPAFALDGWGRARTLGRPQPVNTVGTYAARDADAMIVWCDDGGSWAAPYRDPHAEPPVDPPADRLPGEPRR